MFRRDEKLYFNCPIALYALRIINKTLIVKFFLIYQLTDTRNLYEY
jgi:hypothetical protein